MIASCRSLPVLTVLASLACTSADGDRPTDAEGFGQRYRFANNEVTGWTQGSSALAYSVWTDANLTGKIDGAAPVYVDRGCKLAMYQDLLGPDPQICTVVAMDFVTDPQATAMFEYQKESAGDSVFVPGYDESVAFGYPSLTGATVYAHVKAYYFELQMDGYPDQDSASAAAAPLLRVLESKARK